MGQFGFKLTHHRKVVELDDVLHRHGVTSSAVHCAMMRSSTPWELGKTESPWGKDLSGHVEWCCRRAPMILLAGVPLENCSGSSYNPLTMDSPLVQYVRTVDNYSIAYAVTGLGLPVVALPMPFSHINLYWREETFYLDWLVALSERYRLIQYDGRGMGMSTRGLGDDHCLEALDRDLDAVLTRLNLSGVVLFGSYYSAHTAIRYAVQHPDVVCALILTTCPVEFSDFPMGYVRDLPRQNWDGFLSLITTQVPGSTLKTSLSGIERLRQTVTQSDWMQQARVFQQSSALPHANQVTIPTLVLHARDFRLLEARHSMELASNIPNARFQLVEGMQPPGVASLAIPIIEDFLAQFRPPDQAGLNSALSPREQEVLNLIAAGKSNDQIATELVISRNTVQRHVSNIFAKCGFTNRTEAAAFALRRQNVIH